jgi:uncharacterized protein
MIVDLANVPGSASYDFRVPAGEFDLDMPGVKLMGDVHVSCEITRQIIETVVNGTIEADAEIDCTRCLKGVSEDLEIPFEVSFVAPEAFSADSDIELKGSDLGVDIVEGEQIDLKELAREQILLNLPEQVVCSEACKGLCEKCGADRNTDECRCGDDDIDPRWAALKGLK